MNNITQKQPITLTPGFSLSEQTTLPNEIWCTAAAKLKPFSMIETAIKKDYATTVIAMRSTCKAFYDIAGLKSLSDRLIAEVVKEEAWDRIREEDDYYSRNWINRKTLNKN